MYSRRILILFLIALVVSGIHGSLAFAYEGNGLFREAQLLEAVKDVSSGPPTLFPAGENAAKPIIVR